MRALLSAFVVALALLAGWQGSGRAALDASPASTPTLEVLVFEHADCVYCRAFRRDVLPKYRFSVRSELAPMRFVDVQADSTASLALNGRIDTVPTVVVMRDGQELGRIVGYWGPTSFFKMLAHLLGQDMRE
jgi:thioredoxin-related protein